MNLKDMQITLAGICYAGLGAFLFFSVWVGNGIKPWPTVGHGDVGVRTWFTLVTIICAVISGSAVMCKIHKAYRKGVKASIIFGISIVVIGCIIILLTAFGELILGVYIFISSLVSGLGTYLLLYTPVPTERGIKKPEMPATMHEEYQFLCSQCKKSVQAEWTICPYCKTLLKPEAEDTGSKRGQDVLNAVDELLNKEANFFVDDIKSCLSKDDIEGAEKLLEEKKRLYDRFLELKKDMVDIDKRTTKLSVRLAEGELTSDAYELAMDELKRRKRDIEEETWKIQNKIFREKYEKPF